MKPREFAIGEQAEIKVQNLFSKHGIKYTVSEKKVKEHDLTFSFDGKEYKVEVKFDVKAIQTGNLAIELYNTKLNCPSGLNITQSDIWCIVLADESIYFGNTKKLKEIVSTIKPDRIVSNAGDNNALIYLYKTDFLIEKVFTKMNEIKTLKFINILKELLA